MQSKPQKPEVGLMATHRVSSFSHRSKKSWSPVAKVWRDPHVKKKPSKITTNSLYSLFLLPLCAIPLLRQGRYFVPTIVFSEHVTERRLRSTCLIKCWMKAQNTQILIYNSRNKGKAQSLLVIASGPIWITSLEAEAGDLCLSHRVTEWSPVSANR